MSVEGKGDGKLAYYGTTKSSKGEKKCGVALDEPNGKHDGMVNGQRYFNCTVGHGVLTSYDNVTMLEEGGGAKSLRKGPAKTTRKKTPKKKTGSKTSTPKASGAANAALEEAAKAEAEIEAAMKKMAALEEAAIAEAEIEAATAAMAKLTAASQPEATSAPQTSSPPPPVVRQDSAAELQLKAELEAMKQKLAAANATVDADRLARETTAKDAEAATIAAEIAKLKEAENMATQIQQSRTTASATPPLPDAGSDPMLEARLLQFENKLAAVEQEKKKTEREAQAQLARVTAKVMQRILGGQSAVDNYEAMEQQRISEDDEKRIKEQQARIESERRALEAEERASVALKLVQAAEQTMKEVREGVVSNNSMNNSNNQEMEALKNQLRMANEAKEEAETKARLAQEGKVKVDSVKVKWL